MWATKRQYYWFTLPECSFLTAHASSSFGIARTICHDCIIPGGLLWPPRERNRVFRCYNSTNLYSTTLLVIHVFFGLTFPTAAIAHPVSSALTLVHLVKLSPGSRRHEQLAQCPMPMCEAIPVAVADSALYRG